MLDALMGADRNASLAEKGISATAGRITSRKRGAEDGSLRKLKRSCYDANVCPYYTAWGIDVYDLFTNTKSDMGPNEFIVDHDAHVEFKSLNENEQELLGYERMLQRKLRDLVRKVDWTVTRNKQKLRQEIDGKKLEGRVHVDPLTLTTGDQEKLERAAQLQVSKVYLEKEVQDWLEKLDELERKELAHEQEEAKKKQEAIAAKEKAAQDANAESKTHEHDIIDESGEKSSNSDQDEQVNNNESHPIEFVASKIEEPLDPEKAAEEAAARKRQQEIEAEKKLEQTLKQQEIEFQKIKLLDSVFEKVEQLSAVTEEITQLIKSLHYFRGDTAADKVVCEVSGNFMSARDAEERIAAHYAGKQYVGWKAVREKLKELDAKFRHNPPPRRPVLLPHEREPYRRDKERNMDRARSGSHGRSSSNGRSSDRYHRGGPPPDWDRRGVGGGGGAHGRGGYDRVAGVHDRGAVGPDRGGNAHGRGGGYDQRYRDEPYSLGGSGSRYDDHQRGGADGRRGYDDHRGSGGRAYDDRGRDRGHRRR